MNRELGEIQHEQKRRMLVSFERIDVVAAEFLGSSALAAFLQAGLAASFIIGGVAAAGLEIRHGKRQPRDS